MGTEKFPDEVVAQAAHLLWYCRLHSKSLMWRGIAPAMRAGLDDAATVNGCRDAIERLERLAAEVIERWPHLEPRVLAILRGED